MKDLIDKYKKGREIQFGTKIKAVITTDLIEFKGLYAIYADIIENENNATPCFTYKIHDKVALVVRDKKRLLEMGLNAEERKAIYCHELGHCFSPNQQNSAKSGRRICDEIDSDLFAVEQCGISPYVLERALAKSYEYEISNIHKKKGLTQERLNRYVEEMRARKRNVERLIREFESKENEDRRK